MLVVVALGAVQMFVPRDGEDSGRLYSQVEAAPALYRGGYPRQPRRSHRPAGASTPQP